MPRKILESNLPHVFINCPFDDEYKPLFEAIRYTLIVNGYEPASTRDSDNGAEVRINKIVRLIRSCIYSIHDVSRTELDSINKLPRFNMPLELGLSLGKGYFSSKKKGSLLILDREEFRYQKFISDIGGQDIKAHKNDPEMVIGAIREWLTSTTTGQIQGTSFILKQYLHFKSSMKNLCNKLKIDEGKYSYKDFNSLVRYHHIVYQQWLLTNSSVSDDLDKETGGLILW